MSLFTWLVANSVKSGCRKSWVKPSRKSQVKHNRKSQVKPSRKSLAEPNKGSLWKCTVIAETFTVRWYIVEDSG